MTSIRRLLRLAVLAGMATLSFGAAAQTANYPTHPVRIVVPFSPGGMADIIARTLADKLKVVLGQTVIIDNKAGAGTAIGTALVAKAPADGYTLLLTSNSSFNNLHLTKNAQYKFSDFVAVAPVSTALTVMFVKPSTPVYSLADFIALAKKNPGAITYSSYGKGTTPHLMASMLEQAAGIKLIQVPYGGVAPAVQAVIAGDVVMGYDTVFTSPARIKAGLMRPILVMNSVRATALPDVPSSTEAGYPDIHIPTWVGIMAPAATPPAIVQRLNEAVAQVQKDPEFQARLAASGTDPLPLSRDAFAKLVSEQYLRIGQVVEKAGIVSD